MQPDRVGEVAEFVQHHAEAIVPSGPAHWPESDRDDRWVGLPPLWRAMRTCWLLGDKELIEAADGKELAVVTPRGFWESPHHGRAMT